MSRTNSAQEENNETIKFKQPCRLAQCCQFSVKMQMLCHCLGVALSWFLVDHARQKMDERLNRQQYSASAA
jgi:hypothetical protein